MWKKSSRKGSLGLNAAGFTLLEVMIVMGIIAAIVTLVVPRIGNQNNDIKATVRRFSALSKQLHSLAKLHNATYRLVIDLKNGQDERQEYWVEKSTQNVLLDKESFTLSPSERQDDQDKKRPTGGFEPDPKVLKEPAGLPGDLRIKDVELGALSQPVTTGQVFIHFFPQGRADEAAIHLTAGEKLNWTVAIHPLTGRADVVTQYVELKALRSQ